MIVYASADSTYERMRLRSATPPATPSPRSGNDAPFALAKAPRHLDSAREGITAPDVIRLAAVRDAKGRPSACAKPTRSVASSPIDAARQSFHANQSQHR